MKVRRYRVCRAVSLLVCLLSFIVLTGYSCGPWQIIIEDYLHVYLTWTQLDTSRTMTVNFFHSKKNTEAPSVYYDLVSHDGERDSYAFQGEVNARPVRELEKSVYYSELSNLMPGETYYFIVGGPKIGFSKEYKFKTIPLLASDVSFVTGGDMSMTSDTKALLDEAASLSPDVVLIGGDIAYGGGELKEYGRWHRWLKNYKERMITPDGYMIPLIVAIGNHEVNKKKLVTRRTKAPFYYALFPQSGNLTYFTRQLGKNIMLYVLDTGHIYSYARQSLWLNNVMPKYQHFSYKIALYHVPLYPSYRDFNSGGSLLGRSMWLPAFDKYRLTMAFENHDHTHKRTKLLRNNEVVESDGTLYLGDGCWGHSARDPSRMWYLERASSIPHIWYIQTSDQLLRGEAIDPSGVVIDAFEIKQTMLAQ